MMLPKAGSVIKIDQSQKSVYLQGLWAINQLSDKFSNCFTNL